MIASGRYISIGRQTIVSVLASNLCAQRSGFFRKIHSSRCSGRQVWCRIARVRVEEKAGQPMKESAEQSSLAAEAYTVVRQRILRGEIALGQVISRRKLAAELSMSFLPVSEALLRLEIRGAAREPAARRHACAHSVARRRAGPLRRPRGARGAGGDAVHAGRDRRPSGPS